MRFEQLIVLYGTICVNAKNKEESEKKIMEILFKLKDGKFREISDEELLIGDFERV